VFSGRRQALHDRWFGTLVWHVPAGEEVSLAGWREPFPDTALPAPWRRFAAFLGWSLIGQVVYAIVFLAAVVGSDQSVPPRRPSSPSRPARSCSRAGFCTGRERASARRAPASCAAAVNRLPRAVSDSPPAPID
jgi:hypothetical protein